MSEYRYAPPTDVEGIKADILARERAVRICLAELEMLNERLREKLGSVAWLMWKDQHNADLVAAMNQHTPKPPANGQAPQ